MIEKYFICLLIFISILSLTGCDHTRLSGKIIIPDTKIKVGDKIPLKLEVPEELSGIYRTMWYPNSNEFGEIIEGEELLEKLTEKELENYFGKNENLNPDRITIFIPKKKGKCTIFAAGFYRQTNPQPITSIEIEIE